MIACTNTSDAKPVTISTFYKFVEIDDCEALQMPIKREMIRRGIKGTIILAPEGLNATIAAEEDALNGMMEHLWGRNEIGQFDFKISHHQIQPFKRPKVKVRSELISLGEYANPAVCVGEYVPSSEWNALISRPDVITIDTRNDYEYRIGRFKCAINPDTKDFKEMVAFTQTHLDPAVHKSVAMYCTGGIRCEKYSAYLLEQGFEHVYHLQGGILQYLEDIPEAESMWEGSCFVFDGRVAVTHELKRDPSVTMCFGCGNPLTPDDRAYAEYFDDMQCGYCKDKKQKKPAA